MCFLPLPVGGAPGLRSQERGTPIRFGEESYWEVLENFLCAVTLIMPTPVPVQRTPKTSAYSHATTHTRGPPGWLSPSGTLPLSGNANPLWISPTLAHSYLRLLFTSCTDGILLSLEGAFWAISRTCYGRILIFSLIYHGWFSNQRGQGFPSPVEHEVTRNLGFGNPNL